MKNKKKTRNKKLLRQVGVIVVTIFLLIVITTGSLVYISCKSLYLEAKNDMIDRDLLRIQKSISTINAVDWLVDFCEAHPEDVLQDITQEDEKLAWPYFEEHNDGIITREMLEKESYSLQLAVAKALYASLAMNLLMEKYEFKYESIACMDIRGDDLGFVLYGDSGESDDDDIVLEKQDIDLNEHSALRQLTSGDFTGDTVYEEYRSSENGESFYIGYTPIYGEDGEICCVISISYNWSGFKGKLSLYLTLMSIFGLIILVFAAILLLWFLHRSAIRPLKRIQKGVRRYMNDKDSEAVIGEMDKIRTTNELGALSDDISELALSIDRYNEENIRLATEQERVSAELGLAAKIQSDMLPKEYPDRPEIRLAASMTPAKEIGGDFYDFFMLGDNRLGMVIADVSGKGVPAALFMMMSMMVIRNYARAGKSPSEVLRESNRLICENNTDNMFVTVWFGILDLDSGHVIASNAGHEFPLLHKPNGTFELFKDKHSFVLGGMQGMKYKEYEFDIEKGGTLFLYTDGAPEATDADEQLFGTDRMLETLNRDPGAHPEELIKRMHDAIDAFVGDSPQFDDLTMLCVRYNGKED